MSNIRTIPLRILYTINSSPQYILARSHSPIPVIPVLYNQSNNRSDKQFSSHYNKDEVSTAYSLEQPPIYATASLKICLDTICRSSPELVQDNSRDFSVYVLDPLESNSAPAPVRIANSNSCSAIPPSPTVQTHNSISDQPRGVAVGLGLMSWALLADESDSVTVAGTLIRLGTGQEALEVIFALRETAPMQKASLPAAVRSWGLPPEPSKRTRVHASKCHRESKHPSSNPATTTNTNSLPHNSLSYASPTAPAASSSNPALPASQQSHSASTSASISTSSISSAFTPISTSTSSSSRLSTAALTNINTHSKSRQSKPKPKPKTTRPPSEVEKLLDASAVYLGPPKRKGRPKVFRGGVAMENGETENWNEDTNSIMISSGSDLTQYGDGDKDDEMTATFMSNDAANLDSIGDLSMTPDAAGSSAAKITSTDIKAKPKVKLTNDERPHPPFASTPLIKQPPNSDHPSGADTDKTTLLDVLAALSAPTSSNQPSTQNAALLAALSSIDSAAGSLSPAGGDARGDANPALVNALRQLLSACSKQQSQSHQQSPVRSSPHSQDDEIILLDKENVNPTAFRRRAERERADVKLPFSGASGDLENGNVTVGRTVTNTGLGISMRSNANPSPTSAPVPSSSSTDLNAYPRRKRRLSDFMDERVSGKGSQGETVSRRDAHRHTRRNSSENGMVALRHQPHSRKEKSIRYHRTSMEAWTSPSRHDNETSRRHLITVPISPRGPQVSASSPIRSNFAQSQSRKRYVVPEWARTNTATQPRLSKEAERAIVEAEERRRQEKEAGKKRTLAASQARGMERARGRDSDTKCQSDTQIQTHKQTQNQVSKSGSISSLPLPPPKPIAASSGFPVFGAADTSPLPASSLPSSPISRSSSQSPSPATRNMTHPTTPPPKRADAFSTPGVESSLFTPTPKRWTGRGLNGISGVTGSPLVSPGEAFDTVSLPRSGKKMKLSPIQAVVMGKSIVGGNTGWGRCAAKEARAELQSDREEEEQDAHELEDMLSCELGSALDDLDFPPSSLPTASSDIDIDPYPDEVSDDPDMGLDDDSEENGSTMKQHWSGLPPSSPPPPSSPLLMSGDANLEVPVGDDEIDDLDSECPIATSDTAYCQDSVNAVLRPYSTDELANYFDMNDLDTLSSLPPQSCSDSPEHHDNSEMDLEQFTTFHTQSNPSQTQDNIDISMDQSLDPIIQNGLFDFDFTEFWESMKPLVNDTAHTDTHSDTHAGFGLDFGAHAGDSRDVGMSELDHRKLAEDVHALFSGCLM